MRPQVLLITLAVLAVLAALPLISNGSKDEEEGGAAAAVAGADAANAGSWPCCDQCGFCYRSYPPKCQCLDISHQGCHPACRNCVKYTAASGSSSTHDELPVYRCTDILTNFCERRCMPTAAAAAAAAI